MALSIRLTVCDFYLAPPKIGLDPTFSEFRGSAVTQVPVLRIFGSTCTGSKACLHVHGVFPYMYIPYDGVENAQQQQYLLANALDKAINISFGQTNSTSKHVFKIVLVSGVPFYGYHEKEHQFFKIYLYNPNLIKKAAELLHNGSVLGRMFQPHEAHLPFTLQFMIDYNLQGMHMVNCANLQYRTSQESNPDDPADRNHLLQNVKVSSCEVEADVVAEDILNRINNNSSQGVVNPGLAALWEDEQQRRRDQGRETQPTPLTTQTRKPSGPSVSEEFHRCRLFEKLANGQDSISSSQSSFFYPAEAPEGLINASFVEQHSSRMSDATLTQHSTELSNSQPSDILMNTLDEELLDVLDALAKSQKEDNVEVGALEEQTAQELGDVDDDEEESREMSQPFNSTTFIDIDSSDDDESNQSVTDIFEDSTEFENKLAQLDGSDDNHKPDSRRRRLGVRRCLSRTNANPTPDDWLMQEINNVLERPQELDQFQGQLHNLEDLMIPEGNLAMELLNEEEETKDVPNAIAQPQPGSSKTAGNKQKDLIDESFNTVQSQSGPSETKASVKEQHLGPTSEEKEGKEPAFEVTVSKKTLGTCRGRKKVSFSVAVSDELEVDSESFVLDVCDRKLNLCFDVNSPTALETNGSEKPKEKIELKECFVRLEKLKLPLTSKAQNVVMMSQNASDETEDGAQENHQSVENSGAETPTIVTNVRVSHSLTEEAVNVIKEEHQQSINSSGGVRSITTLSNDVIEDMEPLLISDDDDGDIVLTQVNKSLEKLLQNGPSEKNEQVIHEASTLNLNTQEFTESSQHTPKKRRLSLSLTPLSKRERRFKRRDRRRKLQYQGMTMNEIMLMNSPQSKNGCSRAKKEPDKYTKSSSDESQDVSGMKSFYNFSIPANNILIEPAQPPPKNLELSEYSFQAIKFQPPFYSEPDDGNQPLSSAPCHLPDYTSYWKTTEDLGFDSKEKRTVIIEPLLPPPKPEQLLATGNVKEPTPDLSEMDNLQQARAVVHENHLNVMHLEVLAASRGKLNPDPEVDPVCAMYFLVHGDRGAYSKMGVIAVRSDTHATANLLSPEMNKKCQYVEIVPDEFEALSKLVHLVQTENPDILMGYEIEMHSWGYVVQRAARIGLNLPNIVSRVPKTESLEARHIDVSQGAIVEYSDLKIPGRVVLNLWRLLRHEVALQNYSLESVSFHLLRQRLPHHPESLLMSWWAETKRCFLVSTHLLTRLLTCHRILCNLDLLGRTSELAKLFGIQFSEVLSRGSQFRVESMMLRLAKPRNFVPVSPAVTQKAMMKAPECIALVMEPQSLFYEDPVAVLDFQSLYPSVIIAHNLCFSTCLGRVELLGKDDPFEFGCTILKVDPRKLKKLEPFVSPNGVAFVPKSVRQGILPAMLSEILETRLMVKQSLKFNKKDETLAKVLHARQLGLKLIANVTYGYTAANFSGRMPCIEVGDSVVSKGREILERAISMVNQNQHVWGGEVVYGDTDSMFVLFRGKTRQEAFDIAEKIADAVTRDNPSPVKLKMEKVYQPCILQTKKRYVGFMYESKHQEEPVYEAKGIETVRRDGCPAVSKLLEKCLRILFTTKDLSLVKSYAIDYFQQVLLGTVSLQDFIFAKEFRGLSGYRPGACVPALELARQWVRVDRRAEPRRSERVPYVIIAGAPGLPLIRLVRSPHQLLDDPALRLNAEYYLTRALVPPLARCFNLLAVDVSGWLADMPRRTVVGLTGKGSIAHFFGSLECPICRSQTRAGLCQDCKMQPQMAAVCLGELVRASERARQAVDDLCGSCCGRRFDLECDSLACPVMYRRRRDIADDGVFKLKQCLQDLSF
ncbi:DNA polymerase zeta catalytic subunit isoform X2 [Cloeon dipterum]|uniref:DNA polymerase zeta catalytic subunit isoform X2 n=1 Tax=Cloeon dipterum TaxID=197152 RepID=UPI0032209D15